MADVVVSGAGSGGAIMACEPKDQLRREDKVTAVTNDPRFHVVPSTPSIALGWRNREDIIVDLAPKTKKKEIDFIPVAAERLHPEENRTEPVDGGSVHEKLVANPGLDGVGDTKGLPERQMRGKHVKWMTDTRIKRVEDGRMCVEEMGEVGGVEAGRDLPFAFSMMPPACRGIEPVSGIQGLSNPRDVTIVDQHPQNPKDRNIFAVGVCVTMPPMGPTPMPCGVRKTGFMIDPWSPRRRTTSAIRSAETSPTSSAPGTLSAARISATGASPLSRNPGSRRGTSTGHPRTNGCTSPSPGSGNTSSASCGRAPPGRSPKVSR
ncbi:MAG: hypothetical protein ACK4P8_09770 [Tabrizicola sp.]